MHTPLLTRGFWIMQQRYERFEVSIIEKGLVNDQKKSRLWQDFFFFDAA
jgi:hypothetical protein